MIFTLTSRFPGGPAGAAGWPFASSNFFTVSPMTLESSALPPSSLESFSAAFLYAAALARSAARVSSTDLGGSGLADSPPSPSAARDTGADRDRREVALDVPVVREADIRRTSPCRPTARAVSAEPDADATVIHIIAV